MSVIRDRLINYNNTPSFDEFEIKESLLIKRDRPVLSKNISSAKLFFLTITRTLNIFIIPQYWFITLFEMLVTAIVICKLRHFLKQK